jgi:nucleoside-diphosphate-sugar epimerase
VGGTLNVLEAARAAGVRRVVLASSTAVYGPMPPLPTAEETPPSPATPYAAHKAGAEMLCAAYRATFGMETVSLRYFNVYGTRQPADSPYAGVIAIFARRLTCGLPVTLHGTGEQTRDFIHVSDVAEITLRAATGADPGAGAINAGTGAETSIRDLLEGFRAALGGRVIVQPATARTGDVMRSCAEITRLRVRMGYVPRTSLAEGLAGLLPIVSAGDMSHVAVEAAG